MRLQRDLPDDVRIEVADEVRRADLLSRERDYPAASLILENVLAGELQRSAIIPPWLAGRMAAAYRSQKRYRDELEILERYQASQVDDGERTRHSARMTKARVLAESVANHDSIAIVSIRSLTARRKAAAVAGGLPRHGD